MWIWLCLGGLGLACCALTPKIVQQIPGQSQMIRPEETRCTTHADCVRIKRIDGCGCTAGGFDGVANKKFAETIRKRIQSAFPGCHCPAVMSGHPACIGVIPWCHEGHCHLVHKE